MPVFRGAFYVLGVVCVLFHSARADGIASICDIIHQSVLIEEVSQQLARGDFAVRLARQLSEHETLRQVFETPESRPFPLGVERIVRDILAKMPEHGDISAEGHEVLSIAIRDLVLSQGSVREFNARTLTSALESLLALHRESSRALAIHANRAEGREALSERQLGAERRAIELLVENRAPADRWAMIFEVMRLAPDHPVRKHFDRIFNPDTGSAPEWDAYAQIFHQETIRAVGEGLEHYRAIYVVNPEHPYLQHLATLGFRFGPGKEGVRIPTFQEMMFNHAASIERLIAAGTIKREDVLMPARVFVNRSLAPSHSEFRIYRMFGEPVPAGYEGERQVFPLPFTLRMMRDGFFPLGESIPLGPGRLEVQHTFALHDFSHHSLHILYPPFMKAMREAATKLHAGGAEGDRTSAAYLTMRTRQGFTEDARGALSADVRELAKLRGRLTPTERDAYLGFRTKYTEARTGNAREQVVKDFQAHIDQLPPEVRQHYTPAYDFFQITGRQLELVQESLPAPLRKLYDQLRAEHDALLPTDHAGRAAVIKRLAERLDRETGQSRLVLNALLNNLVPVTPETRARGRAGQRFTWVLENASLIPETAARRIEKRLRDSKLLPARRAIDAVYRVEDVIAHLAANATREQMLTALRQLIREFPRDVRYIGGASFDIVQLGQRFSPGLQPQGFAHYFTLDFMVRQATDVAGLADFASTEALRTHLARLSVAMIESGQVHPNELAIDITKSQAELEKTPVYRWIVETGAFPRDQYYWAFRDFPWSTPPSAARTP